MLVYPNWRVNGSYVLLLFMVALFSGLGAIGIGILLLGSDRKDPGAISSLWSNFCGDTRGDWRNLDTHFYDAFIYAGHSKDVSHELGTKCLLRCDHQKWKILVDILSEIGMLGLFFTLLMMLSVYVDKLKF